MSFDRMPSVGVTIGDIVQQVDTARCQAKHSTCCAGDQQADRIRQLTGKHNPGKEQEVLYPLMHPETVKHCPETRRFNPAFLLRGNRTVRSRRRLSWCRRRHWYRIESEQRTSRPTFNLAHGTQCRKQRTQPDARHLLSQQAVPSVPAIPSLHHLSAGTITSKRPCFHSCFGGRAPTSVVTAS